LIGDLDCSAALVLSCLSISKFSMGASASVMTDCF
jgi:hypothetical protein